MRIWNYKDARVYDGTPVEILAQMKLVETAELRSSLDDYIEAKRHDAQHHWNVELKVTGDDLETRAASLLDAMVANGLAKRVA